MSGLSHLAQVAASGNMEVSKTRVSLSEFPSTLT